MFVNVYSSAHVLWINACAHRACSPRVLRTFYSGETRKCVEEIIWKVFFGGGGGGEVGKEKGPWRGCQIGRVLKIVKMSKKLCSLLKAYVTNFCLVVPSDSSIYFRNEWKWQSTHFCRQESQVRFVGLSFHSHSSAICAVIPTSLKALVCLTQYIVKCCELI